MANKIKKKVILTVGKSGSGKDYFFEKMSEKLSNIERISGGDLCKKVASKIYNYDGVSKDKDSRLLLNKVSKEFRTNKVRVNNMNIYKDFLTEDEFTLYNNNESFWTYCLICQIRNSKNDIFMMTDLRFKEEYETFMKYKFEFDIIFLELFDETTEYSASDFQIDEIVLNSIFNINRNYIIINDKGPLFDEQINRLFLLFTDLYKYSPDFIWEELKKEKFFDGECIDVNSMFESIKEKEKNIFSITNYEEYLNYLYFILYFKYGFIYEDFADGTPISINNFITYPNFKEVSRYLIPINDNIKKQLIQTELN